MSKPSTILSFLDSLDDYILDAVAYGVAKERPQGASSRDHKDYYDAREKFRREAISLLGAPPERSEASSDF